MNVCMWTAKIMDLLPGSWALQSSLSKRLSLIHQSVESYRIQTSQIDLFTKFKEHKEVFHINFFVVGYLLQHDIISCSLQWLTNFPHFKSSQARGLVHVWTRFESNLMVRSVNTLNLRATIRSISIKSISVEFKHEKTDLGINGQHSFPGHLCVCHYLLVSEHL